MDGRQVFNKHGGEDGFLTERVTLGRNENSAADSWFKKRLHYVRSELRKEMQTKLIRVAREK